MVLLMTSKYPNKANVAYATLLSTDPEAIVGTIKTGSVSLAWPSMFVCS
jgi:hypothetical protein